MLCDSGRFSCGVVEFICILVCYIIYIVMDKLKKVLTEVVKWGGWIVLVADYFLKHLPA